MTPQAIIRALAVLPMRNEIARWDRLTVSERRFIDWIRYAAPGGVRLTAAEVATLKGIVEAHGA